MGPDRLRLSFAPLWEGDDGPSLEQLVDQAARIDFHYTDLGNARLLAGLFKPYIRYCPQFKSWLIWNGCRWEKDETGKINQFAKLVTKIIFDLGRKNSDETKRKDLIRWGLQSESAYHIQKMIDLAQSEPGIPVTASRLDADPMLLCVENGVIELKTGKLRQARRDDYVTKQAPVIYDPTAKCPEWNSFLDQILYGTEELIAYHQRLIGYCLTGLTGEQCFFMPYGIGANGKTVLWETVKSLIGDYAATTPPETLMKRKDSGGPSPDLARLQGIRLALASEPEKGSMLAEPVVKRITGEDSIACRNLYGNFFEFKPQFKVVLITNHLPRVQSQGLAIWRRIHPIPYGVVILPKERDKSKIAKLQAELPGILNWALEGLRAYLNGLEQIPQGGLAPPACIQEAINEYKSDMDILGDWIDECAVEISGEKTPVGELYTSYQNWCRASGHRPLSKKSFSMELVAR